MNELNTLSLNALRAVEAVGRLGSLKLAAGELGVSVGAVSQQIGKAEEQLGKALFLRTSQGLQPTAVGAAALPRLASAFRELSEAAGLIRHRQSSVLTISVAPVFASKWLVPRLARYAALHPDVIVRLDATTDVIDLERTGVDVAIRVGAGHWKGVDLDFLLPQEIFPVCAPQIAERLSAHADILSVPAVVDANSILHWETWLAEVGLSGASMKTGYTFTDASLALDAAIAGQGVMLGWVTLASHALAAGQLVAPFPERARTGLGYYIVTTPGRREQRIDDFKTWLKSEIDETVRSFQA